MKNKKKMCFGVIIGTRAYFNSELAKDVRKQLLETLTKEGYDYVILPEDATPTGSSSIETREDGLKCAKLFRENRDRIDGIIVSLPNFGFEIGIINAISVADLNVPVLVQACSPNSLSGTSGMNFITNLISHSLNCSHTLLLLSIICW